MRSSRIAPLYDTRQCLSRRSSPSYPARAKRYAGATIGPDIKAESAPGFRCAHPGYGRVTSDLRVLHIRQRESRDALVVLRQRAQLVLRDVVVEIVERAVADQLLHFD